jgi:uncharacterized protein
VADVNRAAYRLLRPLLLRPGPVLAVVCVAALCAAGTAAGGLLRQRAELAPLALDWAQLIPPGGAGGDSPLALRGVVLHGMLGLQANQEPERVVRRYSGRRVAIDGYVVPLDFDGTRVATFLLVPYVGACIHVPPPPPNQIIYVTSTEGADAPADLFAPVRVTGVLAAEGTATELAEVGYRLAADEVEVVAD